MKQEPNVLGTACKAQFSCCVFGKEKFSQVPVCVMTKHVKWNIKSKNMLSWTGPIRIGKSGSWPCAGQPESHHMRGSIVQILFTALGLWPLPWGSCFSARPPSRGRIIPDRQHKHLLKELELLPRVLPSPGSNTQPFPSVPSLRTFCSAAFCCKHSWALQAPRAEPCYTGNPAELSVGSPSRQPSDWASSRRSGGEGNRSDKSSSPLSGGSNTAPRPGVPCHAPHPGDTDPASSA